MIPFPDPPLRGDAFVLRKWSDADSHAYAAAMQDPESERWLNDYTHETADDIDALRVNGTMLVLTIADPDTDEFLGFVALIMKAWRIGEIGYMVAPAARGRGLAAAVVQALGLWAAAAPLELARLELHIEPANTASIRVAERCGYRFEGVLRSAFEHRGRRADVALYARLPGDPPPV